MICYRLYGILGKVYVKFLQKIVSFFGRRKCYICGNTFFTYLPVYGEEWYVSQIKKYGINKNFSDMTYNKKEFICPYCKSIDRTRFIMIYINKYYRRKERVKILYFAPTSGGISFLGKMNNMEVDTIDLYNKGVKYNYDIQNLSGIKDNIYDLIICSHVLEHVNNDILALKELYRVTKEGGKVLILVPLDLNKVWLDEEYGLNESENWKRFGQIDHVRRYTEDEIVKRMTDVGFKCRIFTRNNLDDKVVTENAFNKNIRIYIAEKRTEGE